MKDTDKITVKEFNLLLKQALNNLHASKGLIFNVEMELKRLIKNYDVSNKQ